MVQPSPKDLGGLLNANALYSFATGAFQLFLGFMLLKDYGCDLETIIPLVVSGAALLLCLANVIFDFAEILMRIDLEQRQGETITRRNAEEKRRAEEEEERARDAKRRSILAAYGQEGNILTAAQELGRDRELETVNQQYNANLERMYATYGNLLETKLGAWRRDLERELRLLRGQTNPSTRQGNRPSALADAEAEAGAIDQQVSAIKQQCAQAIGALDASAMSPQDFAQKVQQIQHDRDCKIAAMDDARAKQLALRSDANAQYPSAPHPDQAFSGRADGAATPLVRSG